MVTGSFLLGLCYAGLVVIIILAVLWVQDDKVKKRQAEEREQAKEKTKAVKERMKQVRQMDREEQKKESPQGNS